MITSILMVDKSALSVLNRVSTATHELGHAVGLPHHGWKVENWQFVTIRFNRESAGDQPNVVPPGTDCIDPRQQPSDDVVGLYRRGEFVGCGGGTIVARNGENSGNAECPLRYSYGDFREAPGSTAAHYVLTEVDGVMLDSRGIIAWTDLYGARPNTIRLWQGRFLKYDDSLDHEAVGRFCLLNKGTGLNALPGDQNHAGDSQVACMDQLVINDNVLRGVR